MTKYMTTQGTPGESVLDAAKNALRAYTRVDAEHNPISLALDADTLTIAGEVGDIAAKKLAVRRVAAVDGVAWVVDRLRVRPAATMGDAEIRDHVRDAFLLEPALSEVDLSEQAGGVVETISMPQECRGEVRISVEDGVVTLEGELPSRAHKRLAVLLAWWIPGTRDVVEGLAVAPYERDNDDEITDSVRTALEKDPLVDACASRWRKTRWWTRARSACAPAQQRSRCVGWSRATRNAASRSATLGSRWVSAT